MKKQACSLKVHKSTTCSWLLNPDVLAVIGLIPRRMRYRFYYIYLLEVPSCRVYLTFFLKNEVSLPAVCSLVQL